jgi:HEAT repeat protein
MVPWPYRLGKRSAAIVQNSFSFGLYLAGAVAATVVRGQGATIVPLSRRRRAQQTYRLTLLTFATLAAILSLFVVAILERGAVGHTIRSALRDVSALSDDEARVAGELTLIPLAAGALTYLLAAQGIRLLRLSIYLSRLHETVGKRLGRTAPLYRLSHLDRGADLPLVAPVDDHGSPLGKPAALPRMLMSSPHILLIGTAAAGKTTALLGLAFEASRRRELVPLFLGRRALPMLVSLPQYAVASSGAYDRPNLDYLAEQAATYSSPGFAARTASYLKRNRVLLLCDDLDETPEADLERVVGHLSRFGARPYRRVRVVAAANVAARDLLAHQVGDTKTWRTLELGAQQMEDSSLFPAVKRHFSAKIATEAPAALRGRLLDDPRRLPLVLTALTALTALTQTPDEAALPHGLARLLADRCRRQCDIVANEEIPTAYLLQFLGGLASALCASGEHAVALEPATGLGCSVGAWLEIHRPQAPVGHQDMGGVGLSGEQIEALCVAAHDAGLLLVSPDGAALRFTHRLIEATCAALWLLDHDDPSAPLDPRLLGAHWTIPLIFWAGLAERPERVADALLRLRQSSRSAESRAGPMRYATLQPAALALALGVAFYGGAVQLAALRDTPADSTRAAARVETHLRAILDEALAAVSDASEADDIRDAASAVWQSCGPELDTAMRLLVHAPALGRLTQAELYTCIGLFGSPVANELLMERLGEREPTVRAGVTHGLTLAGYSALPSLQAAMTSADEGVRTRATEVIDAIAASDETGATGVHRAAVHVLATGAPSQRAAAAETLGALQAHPAVEPLIARLRDREPEVRVAAARALGKLAAPEALEPLRTALRHAGPELRAVIAEALGEYHSSDVAPDLARLLDDPSPVVRAAAATALGALPDEAAIIALKAHSGDPDPATQAVIVSALRRLGQR